MPQLPIYMLQPPYIQHDNSMRPKVFAAAKSILKDFWFSDKSASTFLLLEPQDALEDSDSVPTSLI